MAGEIQLNSTSFASESGGTITINNATVGSAVAMSANQTCVKTAINASGSAPIYACRAWVNFNGTGTVAIRDSGNVSSITDNGTGDYTVNFATAMPDANYAVFMMQVGTSNNANQAATSQTASSCRCETRGGSNIAGDADRVTLGVFR